MNNNKINNYGALLRFITPITPILITIILFILNGIKDDFKTTKLDIQRQFEKLETYHINHLKHHKQFDKEIEHRLTLIEALFKKIIK